MFVRFLGWLFASAVLICAAVLAIVGYSLWWISRDLPDYEQLAGYEPPVITRMHAADGTLIAEYAKEARIFLPVSAVPKMLINAFLSAEDKNFYEHSGLDYESILMAGLVNFRNVSAGRRPVGASTITQQVAKNFLLTNELSYERKIKEAILALRIERAFSKDRLLELYLNEIYFGLGAYGIAAASLNYFGKSVGELELHEMAYLAALPKAPNNYNPFRFTEKAKQRRNWVLSRMQVNGFITGKEAYDAQLMPLGVNLRSVDPDRFVAQYFAEEVRRDLYRMYGEDKLYEGGLSVRTTLDPALQVMAHRALVKGLVTMDRLQGWRGPVARVDVHKDWLMQLMQIRVPGDIAPWRAAVVLKVDRDTLEVGLRPHVDDLGREGSLAQEKVVIAREGFAWSEKVVRRDGKEYPVLQPGDVVYVTPDGMKEGWELVQIPEVEGAIVAMDPHTGRVLAMVGGFSYEESEFNRATQALRQPGSAFKPFVYLAALANGYTPSSIIWDAPIEVDQGPGLDVWRPKNYGGKFAGPSTLRYGVERSRNLMTVHLANDIGMSLVAEYGKRFGIYDDLLPVLSMSLGAGETTVLRLTAAYAMICNGGLKVTPTLIDRIQDRRGRTIFRHDDRECIGCSLDMWDERAAPVLIGDDERVVDQYSAYQMTSILEGAVIRGTAKVVSSLGRPLAGKTGTTNEERDAWFIGYSPDLVAGVFVGYDTPRPMGRSGTGGRAAAPIFRDFMKMALEDRPVVPFRVPPGIQLFRINAKTGLKAGVNDQGTIMEPFRPGTAPPGEHSLIGYSEVDEQNHLEKEMELNRRPISSGTGGLY